MPAQGRKKEGDPLWWTHPELNRTPFAKSPKCEANVINQLHHVHRLIPAIPTQSGPCCSIYPL